MKPNYYLLITSFLWIFSCQKNNQSPASGSIKIEVGDITKTVISQGYFKSPTSVPIVVQRIGWSWNYNIVFAKDEGTFVKKDEVIFKLDTGEFDKEIDRLKGEVDSNKLELKETEFSQEDLIENQKNQITLNEIELKKARLAIIENDTIPDYKKKQNKLDVEEKQMRVSRAKEKLKNTIETAKKQIQLKKMTLEQNERELNEGLANVKKTSILSPSEGILIYKNFRAKGILSKPTAGSSLDVNTQIAEISGKTDLQAFCLIPEIDSEGIKPTTKVKLYLTALPQHTIEGEVVKVSEMPSTSTERGDDTVSGSHNQLKQFEVWVSFKDIPSIAMPGMTLKAEFEVFNLSSVLRIPITSVVTKSDLPKGVQLEGSHFAYTKSKKNSTWTWQAVELGNSSLTHIEVKSGLEKGDEVALIAPTH